MIRIHRIGGTEPVESGNYVLLETNPDASLKSFLILRGASPDGSYATNLRLAKLRTDKGPWNVYWHNWTRKHVNCWR